MSAILVELRANAGEFMTKMAAARHEIQKLGTESSAHMDKAAAVGKASFLGLTGGALALGGASLKMAADFQEGLTTLVTGAGEAEKNIGMVGDGIKRIAVSSGTSTQQLTDGMYMIESAGFHGAQGLKLLESAAQGAKVGGAQMGDVANALTSALHAYGLSADQAIPVTNSLIATVASGKMHMQDLAESLAKVIPAAAAVHVPLQQVEAAMASMTASGTPAADAATYLRQVLVSFSAPGAKAADSLASIGTSAEALSSTLSTKGLYAAMKLVSDHMTQHLTPGTAAWTQALENVAGGKRQMMAVLELMPHLKEFGSNLQTITDKTHETSTSVAGWDLVQKDLNTKIAQAHERMNTLAITVGTKLIPIVSSATKFLNDHKTVLLALASVISGALVTAMTIWIGTQIRLAAVMLKDVAVAMARIAVAVAAQIVAFANLAVSMAVVAVGYVRQGVAAVASATATIAAATASRIAAAAQWLLNAALAANPIGLVVIAIAALVAALVWAYFHVGWFRKMVDSAWQGIIAATHALGDAWSWVWNGIVTVVQSVWSVIGPIVEKVVGAVGKVVDAAGKVAKFAGGALSGAKHLLGFADGTNYAPGGLAMVGERGPELMYVPRGAQVIPNHRLAGLGGGESTVHVAVHVDGEVVARAVQRANKRYAVRNGRGLFATA